MISAAVFQRLYEAQVAGVYNYVRYRLGDAEAEDLTAAAFTRAWDLRAQQDPGRGSLEAWLWAIVRRMVADRRRFLRRRPQEPLGEDLPMPEGDLGAMVLAHLDQEALLQALDGLPELERELIALRFGGGLSHRLIARELGLTEGASAQRLRRALARLRSLLTPPAGPLRAAAQDLGSPT